MTFRIRSAFVVGLAVTLAASACVPHIAPHRRKERRFDPGEYGEAAPRSDSSLYGRRPGLFEDDRPLRVGDVVVVRIDESEVASRKASTALSHSNESSRGVSGAFGMVADLHPALDAANLAGASTDSNFKGTGTVERQGSLRATLPVKVRRVLPNGDLYVEGSKVIMVGAEEHHLYVSGIVRPADVGPDNTVASTRLADAEIEYSGRGDVSDQQRPGWLSRIVTAIWPW